MHVLVTCKKSGNTIFPSITLWELFVAMETRVINRSALKLEAAFPKHNDASEKIDQDWPIGARDIQVQKFPL